MIGQILAWSFLFTLPGLVLTALIPTRRRGVLSLGGPLALFGLALAYLFEGAPTQSFEQPYWAPFLPDHAFRLLVDPLAGVMLAVVGFVASCVYVYSLDYMSEDPRARRFFIFLDVFVATMCLLVAAGNLTVLLLASIVAAISLWRRQEGPR